MIAYRLRTRLAPDLPWSDYTCTAPLELLLRMVRRCQDDGVACIRLESRAEALENDRVLIVEVHSGHGQCPR